MAVKNDFLVRNNLSDTGKLPRSGSWTGSPDILVAGQSALSTQEMISKYGQAFDQDVKEYFTNNFYVRAKNVSAANATQNVYLFRVPQNLFLAPNVWYNEDNLMVYTSVVPDPNDPTKTIEVRQDYQTLSAAPNEIVATNAFTWKPQTTVEVDESSAATLMKLVDTLEEDDDVQTVWGNYEVSDEVMEKLG